MEVKDIKIMQADLENKVFELVEIFNRSSGMTIDSIQLLYGNAVGTGLQLVGVKSVALLGTPTT